MDKNQQAKQLIIRYHQGLATAEERRIVEQWFLIDLERSDVQLDRRAYEKTERRVRQNLGIHTDSTLQEETVQKDAIQIRPLIAASMVWKIAAAITAITLGVWLYYTSSTNGLFGGRHPELVSGSPLANDIAPGKNTATLTLANGKTIELSDAKTGVVISEEKFIYSDGAEIPDQVRHDTEPSSAQAGQMLTASTPRGGTYQFILPDGSKVWLNAASSIKFPSTFEGAKQRSIELTGEAYFEIFKNKNQKFVVTTKNQKVEVLGTHFNINSYADEGATRTTLLEGAVRVSYRTGPPVQAKGLTQDLRGSSGDRSTADQQMVTLKPGQQASLKGGELQVKAIDAQSSIDWKNGEFIFDEEPLESIMRKIMRWYNVEVEYRDIRKNKAFSGTVSRFAAVSETLKMLELTGEVHFKIEGRQIIVMK